MPFYMKAYQIERLRAFDSWEDKDPALADDALVYLREDFLVARTCFEDAEILFDAVTDAWKISRTTFATTIEVPLS